MAERIDDVSLGDDELLWRRIIDRPNEWFTIADDGTLVASSAAFKDSTNEVSVNVASQTTVKDVLGSYEDQGLVSITVELPRSLGHIVAKTLEPDDPDDPSHRVICPPSAIKNKQRMRDARLMARSSIWIIYPKSLRKQKSV